MGWELKGPEADSLTAETSSAYSHRELEQNMRVIMDATGFLRITGTLSKGMVDIANVIFI